MAPIPVLRGAEGRGGATLRTVVLRPGADLDGFRRAARALVRAGVAPERASFVVGEAPGLFGAEELDDAPALVLPRPAADLVRTVLMHRDPERHHLAYQLVWRVLQGERALTEVGSDPLVHRLHLMNKAIRRDLHKMHAFVRFRRVEEGALERFVAWFEPDHHILAAAAPFFVDRFRSLTWSILTPDGSAHWAEGVLRFGPPGRREDAPAGDAFEEGWLDYYGAVFNPARVNPRAMRAEMPKKYWRNLPEAATIPALIAEAPERARAMVARQASQPRKRRPEGALQAMHAEPESLAALNAVIRAAEPLVPGATGAVLGEGPVGAAIAFVGEQPGDHEDREGRPFVGPAGAVLMRALGEIGIPREGAYLTNAVKHFKFVERGKRRIHQSPTAGEVKHYRWWLLKELDLVRPRLVVALGATAVLALTGRPASVTRIRGAARLGEAFDGVVTVHPSYLLRLPDGERAEAYRAFVADLALARDLAA